MDYELCRCQSSLQDEEHVGRLLSAVIPENVFTIRNMLIDDICCPYEMIQREISIGSAAYLKLFMKNCLRKIKFCFVSPHDLTEN